jgi:subtilisin family serine protease
MTSVPRFPPARPLRPKTAPMQKSTANIEVAMLLPKRSTLSFFSACTLLSAVALLAFLAVFSILAAFPMLAQNSSQNANQAPGSPLSRGVPGRFILAYRNGIVPADSTLTAAGAHLVARHDRLGMAVVTSSAGISALSQLPGVELIAQDRIVSASALHLQASAATPSVSTPDALYNSPQGWAVRQVGGFGATSSNPAAQPGPWNMTQGAGVRIAILDSGVDAAHPDIAPNLALNLTEVDQSSATGLPSPCDDGSPQDQQGHGTWTASLAAAALGPNTGLVAGVAPQATILNIKVLERMPASGTDSSTCAAGQASGLLSWVIQGIDDAVANRADIISMSLGSLVDITTGDGAGLQAIFDQATHAAANAGVILIASAGNDGLSLANPRYIELPAQSRDVLALVASTNPACAENLTAGSTCVPGPVSLPYYSNFGLPLNALAAPGGSYPEGPATDSTQPTGWIVGACSEGLPSTVPGIPSTPGQSFGCFGLGHVQYVQAMGTSASAPLAAGAAALILAANPTWTPAQVVAALRASATSIPTLPVPQINAAATVMPFLKHTAPIVSAPKSF